MFFKRLGLSDWLIQRYTAIYLAGFLLWFVVALGCQRPLSFDAWWAFTHRPWVQVASTLAWVSLLAHAWIGVWTVLTDYVKCTCLRKGLEAVVILALIFYGVWALALVWGGV